MQPAHLTPDSVAGVIARFLKARGVDRIFALCGGHIMPMWMRADAEGIRIIDVRDERAAVYMAHAHAELTGNLGVAMVTAGPGVTNAMTGIANAHVARAPVLVLADMLAREQGHAAAAGFIAGQLMGRPSLRGSAKYADLMLSCPTDPPAEILVILKGLVDQLLHSKPVYRCRECGFAGKTLHWQCPACKNWDVVRPIHGIEGD